MHNWYNSIGLAIILMYDHSQIKLQEIAKQDEFHRDDFTVVVQPFMEKVESPRKVTF